MDGIRRIDILGVEISAVDMPTAVEVIDGWLQREERQYVCVTGVHGVMESQRDPALRQIHNDAGLATPDGMPMVWCGKWAGASWVRRVYGPDLLLDVSQRCAERGWRIYLYGAAEGVPEDLAAHLHERFPGLQIVGHHSPPFRPLTAEEVQATAEMVNRAEPHVVWVGLSTPKQEQWMARFRPLLDAPVLIGVGAAFDIHAGRIPQAPAWMQRSGLEWLYRMIREPRRLWRRYLSNNPRFVWAVLRRPPRLIGDVVLTSPQP